MHHIDLRPARKWFFPLGFLLSCWILAGVPGWAEQAPSPGPGGPDALAAGAPGVVTEIVDGDTLNLEDGRIVRLVGLQAPKLPLDRPGFRAWPLADEARDRLAALALGRRVGLRYGGRRQDRHGRELAHLVREADGLWLQRALLAEGFARVYSFRDNRALLAELLAVERQARAARRGIWRHPYYAVRRDTETPQFAGSFQLVEGRVRAVALVRGRAYLNFGDDWRSDFTIAIAPRDVRLFEQAGQPPAAYEGRSVRVRGWLKTHNGVLVTATHPEQIEVLE